MATTREQALGWVTKLHAKLTNRRTDIIEQLEYLNGKHPLKYATKSWSKFHQARFNGFSDNWCGVVANTGVRRLRIDGIRLGDDLDILSDDEKQLMKDWERNDLPSYSKQGWLMAAAAKRSYTITWADSDQNPLVTWESPLEVVVQKDATGRRTLAALKVWEDDEENAECATLFLPDSVWKWKRPRGMQVQVVGGGDLTTESGLVVPSRSTLSHGQWEPRQGSDDTWPIKNPAGEVLVAEWANRPFLTGEPLSDIAGTMSMQNSINLLWAYLFTALDSASMPARLLLGAEPPRVPILDENGQEIGTRPVTQEDLVNGRVLFVPGSGDKTPTAAQWEASNLEVFIKVVQEAIAHVAAQTSTPGHYLLSNEKFANLNADALTAAEVPLVDKIGDVQLGFTPPAKQTFRHMALVRGNGSTRTADQILLGKIQWKDQAMHSVGQIADAATKDRTVGISLETVLRTRYGMNPDEIRRELDAVRAEQASVFAAARKPPLTDQTGATSGGGVASVGSAGA